jgi:hypothetical protein
MDIRGGKTMKTKIYDIVLTRGNSFGFNFSIEDLTEELTSCYFSCKVVPEDEKYIFQKSLGDGIKKLDDGGYYVKIEPEDTKGIDLIKYYYDLQFTVGEDVYTPLKGRLDVRWNVTEEV